MQELLRRSGFESEIYAENVATAVRRQVRPLHEERLSDAGVLLHYSISSRIVDRALEARGPLLVRYHNVTPAHWFEGVNETIAELCRRARVALPTLATRTTLALADSEFNRRELLAAGYDSSAVLPILLPANGRTPTGARRQQAKRPIVLTVGRIAPNKRIDEVLRTFALFQRACQPSAALYIVGSPDGCEPYERACRRLAERLNLTDVHFTGRVSERRKAEIFAAASVYLSLSEHEGFCVPIVEAMRHGVPVVARAAGAVPETLGRGGIAVETRDHAELAELLDVVVSDVSVREAIRAGQEQELARFDPVVVGKRFTALVAETLA